MKEYIDKEDAIDILFAVFASHWKLDCSSVDDMIQRKVVHTKNKIKEAHAADVVERKRGEWKGEGIGDCSCSLCGVYQSFYTGRTNFCPNCGADMREVTHD